MKPFITPNIDIARWHCPLEVKKAQNKHNANRAKSTVTKYKEWSRRHLQLGGTLMEFCWQNIYND